METINLETGEVTQRSIKNVAKKITLAMAEMETYAPKDGFNAFHKYGFTSVSQYIAHVRPALTKYGLVIIPSLVERVDYEDATTDLTMKYTVIDSETGEYIESVMVGRGQDMTTQGKRMDKGPYKAYSGALKYFLSSLFMIASGDDPDDDKPEKAGQKPKQQTAQSAPAKAQPPQVVSVKAQNGGTTNKGKSSDAMTAYWLKVKELNATREHGLKVLSDAGNDPEVALDLLTGMRQDLPEAA